MNRVCICPVCEGDGEIRRNPGWPDPQEEITERCRKCRGTGVLEVVEEFRHAA